MSDSRQLSGAELAADTCIGWCDAQPGFAFDNERPAMNVRLADYEIDSTPLCAGFLSRTARMCLQGLKRWRCEFS
jgi:hypothetical protein